MSQKKILNREEIKKAIVDTLKPFGVLRIALFGSFARNQLELGSDIDILVTLADPKNRPPIGMQWFILDQELEALIGLPVDLVTETSISSSLRSILQKDLEIIYEKTG